MVVTAAEKQEKLAGGQKEVEEATGPSGALHELTTVRVPHSGPEPGLRLEAPQLRVRVTLPSPELCTGVEKAPTQTQVPGAPRSGGGASAFRRHLGWNPHAELPVPGSVGAFGTGRGQTSAMCLQP